MSLTLIDLLKSTSNEASLIWEKVTPCFEKYYDNQLDNKGNYVKVIDYLLKLINIVIDPETYIYFTDESEYIHVHVKDNKGSYSALAIPWNIFVGYNIEKETLEKYSKEDIIGHCLWEMTYFGFTEKAFM